MKIIYAREELPKVFSKSIFIAGPSPRSKDVKSWRVDALKALESLGYNGVVFIPESKDGKYFDYDKQVMWEHDAIRRSDCVMFWIPRNLKDLPGFTTNDEWGSLKESGKVVFGCPDDAPKTDYQKFYADMFQVKQANTLIETVQLAMNMVSNEAVRVGGECEVPLMIWNTKQFQSWYKTHDSIGNYIKSAKVLWNFRVGVNKDFVFAYTLWVDIWVQAERRFKKNEFIFSRTDVSNVVLYYPGDNLLNTYVVLVKEFRSPVNNVEGFVYELPGGSSFGNESPEETASNEVAEEVGIRIPAFRFRAHEAKQLAATLSTHKSHLYSALLIKDEMSQLDESFVSQKVFGNEEDSERTYVILAQMRDLIYNKIPVDWSTLGMIFKVLEDKK